jgi:hypothetical protein
MTTATQGSAAEVPEVATAAGRVRGRPLGKAADLGMAMVAVPSAVAAPEALSKAQQEGAEGAAEEEASSRAAGSRREVIGAAGAWESGEGRERG